MRITLGISSGIAAYKILDLIKLLQKDGHELKVILTHSSQKMIPIKKLTELVDTKCIYIELFPDNFHYETILKTRKVDHIEVARKTDLFVIAPATANVIGKMSHGIADDFLTTTVLATHAPILVCPSMNTDMWYHPAVQENLKKIQSYGYLLMNPSSGSLACGTDGIGRLPEPEEIYTKINSVITYKESLKGHKILITAGGTQEPIDAARIITNNSSGKMGVYIAEECHRRGAEVLLVHSSHCFETFLPIKKQSFTTAALLDQIIEKNIKDYETLIHVAAVSDYSVNEKKGKYDSSDSLNLELKQTPKIINNFKKWNPNVTLIGFKAVFGKFDDTIMKNKFEETHADAFIVNDISRSDIGFSVEENEVEIILSKGEHIQIDKASKPVIAQKIISTLIAHEILR